VSNNQQACATKDVLMSDGAHIRLRRYGVPGKTRLVMSHGNGLAIDGYAVFWRRLCHEFDVVLFDMRNHGQNRTHNLRAHTWPRFALDLEEIWTVIERAFGAALSVGVFHSLSAVATIIHAIDYGPRYAGLVLFDPPVFPPAGHAMVPVAQADIAGLSARTRRRPTDYADPQELAAQFARRPEFKRWVPGAAEQLASATLKQCPDDARWYLRCPREYEAQVFETNADTRAWHEICRPPRVPLKLVGGDPNLERQTAPALLCHALAKNSPCEYRFIPQTSHFLQIEEPQICADEVSAFASKLSQHASATGSSDS
jgi:pimeloyl-ACP methyl ester carboxylesterase